MENRNKSQYRILLCQPCGIGDAVLVMPAVEAIRKAHPEAYIVMLTSTRAEPLFRYCPYVDRILTLEMDQTPNPLRPSPKGAFVHFARSMRELRKGRFHVAADFSQISSLITAFERRLFFGLIGPRRLIGRNSRGLGFAFHATIPDPPKPVKPEVEYCMDIANLLGGQNLRPVPKVFLSEKDHRYAESFFRKNGLGSRKPVVGISPGTFRRIKRWPEERFAAVADGLVSKNFADVVFAGPKAEIAAVERIRCAMKSFSYGSVGKQSVRELAALIGKFDLLITTDSAPMHFAAAMGTPVVALFGPESPVRYGPYCPDHMKAVLFKPVECKRPCSDLNCKDVKCMKRISVEEVLNAARNLLVQNRKNRG